MANSGPSLGTLAAPADADSIISVGATDFFGIIASYSSRGPTYDGRPKPEICAQGSAIWWARYTGVSDYGRASGTSCATPLVAGVCALVLEAHPDWTPLEVREALMMTASRAAMPDSHTYGWGVIDAWAAIHYDPSGTIERPKEINEDIGWLQCLPNPFQGQAGIRFHLKKSGQVVVSVYDIRGGLVWKKVLGQMNAGTHQITWPGRDLSGRMTPAGVYLFAVESGGQRRLARGLLIH